MKFKQFLSWCNDRACDGCWSIDTISFCIDILDEVRRHPFWRREKVWQELDKEFEIVEKVVKPINRKIYAIYGKEV